MPDPRDTFVSGGETVRDSRESHGGERPWIGVRFLCAGAYVRVARNAAGTAYLAQCPRCGASVRFAVGEGGTSERFFEVRC